MMLENRNALKQLFKNGKHLSEEYFATLIDSMLNQREDHFRGTWQEHQQYYEGDIVIYDRRFWSMVAKGHLCSNEQPSEHSKYWEVLPYDGDWIIQESKDKTQPDQGVIWTKYNRVGISTSKPVARLDISAQNVQSRLQIFPENSNGQTTPEIKFAQCHPNSEVCLTVGFDEDYSCWSTNTKQGFVFKQDHHNKIQISPGGNENTIPAIKLFQHRDRQEPIALTTEVSHQVSSWITNAEQGFVFKDGNSPEGEPPNHNVLMKIRLGRESSQPQVGIGTDNPTARLDVSSKSAQDRVQLLPENPDGQTTPQLKLIQQHENAETYLSTAVDDRLSHWTTNAKEGFAFQQVSELSAPETPSTCLAIRENGRVGIGTANPLSHLDIAGNDGKNRFLFGTEQTNPTLSILNNLNSQQTFTLGISQIHAVLTTNTPEGFLFKATAPTATPQQGDNAADLSGSSLPIDSEKTLVHISPQGNGKIGIGRTPRDYQLDVQGMIQAMAIYSDTNSHTTCDHQPLSPVLATLQQLHPITFKWRSDSSLAEAVTSEVQIGLLADEVHQWFPQVVKTASDKTPEAVAYANLVPVLIQAIKELDEQYSESIQKLNDQHSTARQRLEAQLKKQETLIQQLANRIALLTVGIGVGWFIALLGVLT